MASVLIIGLLVFCCLGIPIGYSIGLASFVTIISAGNIPYIVIPQKLFSGMDSFPILAIPFFMLAGDLMSYGGLNKRILRVANAFFGWISGSLAIVTVIGSMFFAAISGSAVATVSAIGGITIPAMKKEGYKAEFASAVASSAAVVGPIIPPSIPLIIYGAALQMSISDLFLASTIPGLLLGFGFLIMAYVIAKVKKFPTHERSTTKEKVDSIKDGWGALLMPVIILGGIFSGTFTPTEASVIAVVYSYALAAFAYKTIKLKDLPHILSESAITVSTIMLILGFSKVMGWLVVVADLPTILSEAIYAFTDNGILILLLINIILLIAGALMETNAALVILIPVLVPLALSAGVGPLQFGVIMVFNLCVGLLTPPVGETLIVGSFIAQCKLERAVKAMLPFWFVCLAVLFAITYIPSLTLWLPAVLK